jgi:hypothetical protein
MVLFLLLVLLFTFKYNIFIYMPIPNPIPHLTSWLQGWRIPAGHSATYIAGWCACQLSWGPIPPVHTYIWMLQLWYTSKRQMTAILGGNSSEHNGCQMQWLEALIGGNIKLASSKKKYIATPMANRRPCACPPSCAAELLECRARWRSGAELG